MPSPGISVTRCAIGAEGTGGDGYTPRGGRGGSADVARRLQAGGALERSGRRFRAVLRGRRVSGRALRRAVDRQGADPRGGVGRSRPGGPPGVEGGGLVRG